MRTYAIYGQRAVMPLDSLRALLYRERRQAEAIEDLRARLRGREQLLTRALHELAVERSARDPQSFIRQYKRGGSVGKH